MALVRVRIPSPNYSSRSAAVRLIVLHTAEGARTYQSLGSFFANPASKVSSHVGIDDTANTVGEYVPRSGAAWTQASYNSQSVAAELCAFAAWSAAEWQTHPNMLKNCAAWIAEEAAAFNIPIVRLTPALAQGGSRGVCQHKDLGAGGGNHSDCGPAFPMDQVLDMALGGTAPGPTPPKEDDLTPEQDQLLRKVYNMLLSGVGAWQGQTPQDVTWLWNRLVNGENTLNASNFGALMTLDSLLRDANNRLVDLANRMEALEATLSG